MAQAVSELIQIAPDLRFGFRITVTAEGEWPDAEILARPNALLAAIRDGWRME
jgi:hypothetical protein